ncbi:MAG: class I SAM-dependent methyltransferase [Chitinophagaceae bacterium]|nr:class I SAM-dependent methyltransferase [Chitinophagaceae bacterium]
MTFFPEVLERYAEAHTKPESDVLRELNRETHARVLMPQMLSGHLQGQFIRMMSLMLRPKYALEIGTFTGYSAICLCEGLQENGKLFTIDVNEELQEMALRYFEKSGMSHKIDFRIGMAAAIIPTLHVALDLVFIDADKLNYGLYYDLVFDKVRPGGIILADNVLWSGKVVEESQDAETIALKAFSDKVQRDERVDNVLLTLRDGLMVIRKK